MRALGVVMMPPPFDEHLGFLQGHEDLRVEQFVTKFAVEALVVAVFPGATEPAGDLILLLKRGPGSLAMIRAPNASLAPTHDALSAVLFA